MVPSAWPLLMRLQNAQIAPTCSPNRTCARCQATPSASMAARSPVVFNMTAVPSRDTANAVHRMSVVDERTRKRRHHVRTVVCGTPRCSAIGRNPRPPDSLSASPRPITPTSSSRRASTRSGSRAWLRRQTGHRPRRIQIRSTSSGALSQRQYPPQPINQPRHSGHRCAGTTTCLPAAVYPDGGNRQGHMMATRVLAPPFRPSWSQMTGRASCSAELRRIVRPSALPRPATPAAQPILPIIASIDGINTVPKNRRRNRTIQHHPITPLTLVSAWPPPYGGIVRFRRSNRCPIGAALGCRWLRTPASCRSLSLP